MDTTETITINVKTLDSKTFQLTIPKNLAVCDLKKRIGEQTSVPEDKQRLIFQGKVLKDKDNISTYSLKDGHTIHMVLRPPGAPGVDSGQPAQPSQPQPQPHPHPSAPAPSQQGVPRPFGSPSIMLGTITLPEGGTPPDINSLLGNVLGSLGLPNVLGPPPTGNSQSSTPPVDRDQALHGLLNGLNTSIASLSSVVSDTTTQSTQPPAPSNSVENLGSQLSQLATSTTSLLPYLNLLSDLLQRESSLQDSATRSTAQQLGQQVGEIMQRLGSLFIILSSSVSTLQIGQTPGSAVARPPGERHIVNPNGNFSVHVQNDLGIPSTPIPPTSTSIPMFTVTPRAPNAPATSSTQTNNPMISMMQMMAQQRAAQQRAQSGTQTNTSNAPTTPQPQQNPLDQLSQGLTGSGNQPMPNLLQTVFSAVGPMLQQMGQAQPNQQQQRPPQTPQTPANPQAMSQLFSLFGMPPATPQNGAPPSTVQQQPNANPQMMNQLFNSFSQIIQGQQQPQANTNRTVNNNNSNQPASSAAVLMSQTFNAVNQAMSGSQASSVSSVIGSIAQGISPSAEEREDSILAEILQKILDTLTIPDVLQIMGGSWAPLQRVHSVLQVYVKDLLDGNTSQEQIENLVNEIMDSMNDSLNERNLPEDMKSRIKPGYELTTIARHTIRKHTLKLIQLILSPLEPSSTNPFPFAAAIKDWTASFVGELVTLLSQALQGGVTDAAHVIKFFLQDRLGFMGPEFSQVGTNMVTSYIMKTYAQTIANAESADPSTWASTMAVDEIRQANSPPQKPPSDSYLQGSNSKRRKTARLINTNPQQLFNEQMLEAIRNAKVTPKKKEDGQPSATIEQIVEGTKTNLSSQYQHYLSKELKDRANNNMDYQMEPSRFPNIGKMQ